MTPAERQRWLRIRLAVAAYAYEVEDESIIPDHEYDRMSLEVDTSISTGNLKLDDFFREHFDPSTGSWVHRHPEKDKLRYIYLKYHLPGLHPGADQVQGAGNSYLKFKDSRDLGLK